MNRTIPNTDSNRSTGSGWLRGSRGPVAGGLLIGALLMGAVGSQALSLSEPTQAVPRGSLPGGPASFSELVEQVKPAVVNIAIVGSTQVRAGQPRQVFPPGSPLEDMFRQFFQGQPGTGGLNRAPSSRPFRAVGSGFVVSADGYVVTNNHVIERAEEIEVVMHNGDRFSASVQGRDPKTDLALLKVDADTPLAYVELGDSDAARVGDWVLAVGNPFGLGGTVTAGIISARGRDIQAGPFDDFLQVDAPINQGNSGGPLFDGQGKVIGINTAIYSPSGGSIGIGFAIPAAMAADVIDQLKDSGAVQRGWLGVQFQPVNAAIAASLGLDKASGALVAQVMEDSPAQTAGLRAGDVILSVDGEELDDPKSLPRIIATTPAGSELDMTIFRAGNEQRVNVEIGLSEESVIAAAAAPDVVPQGLGMQLAPLDDSVRARYGVAEDSQGVLVTGVGNDSPAARAGIRRGQVIRMIGQQPVQSPNDVFDAITAAEDNGLTAVLLLVEARGNRQFVAVELAA